MNDRRTTWQQALDSVTADIAALNQRREAHWHEFRTLQQLPGQPADTAGKIPTATAEAISTSQFRTNFLLCKLDEDDQRLLRLELRRNQLLFCLKVLALRQRDYDWPAVAAELAISEAELQRRLDRSGW